MSGTFPSGSTPLPALTNQELQQLAYNAGFTGSAVTTAAAIAKAESSGIPNAYNAADPGGSVGLMQINGAAHPNYDQNALLDPQTNMNAAFATYTAARNSFGPWSTYGSGAYQQYLASNQSNPGSTLSAPTNQSLGGDVGAVPSDFVPLHNLTVPPAAQQALTPGIVITTNLDATPWYQDTTLVTGNKRIRSFVTPVSFVLILKNKNGVALCNQSTADGTAHGQPIQVQLNASIRNFQKTSKHVYNKQQGRTGWHVTMWGMQADLIEGQCTTGVFMNQLGLTDFLSTAQVSTDLVAVLNKGFWALETDSAGDVQVENAEGNQMFSGSTSSFRVAAQDAFVELLSLFKNNGNIWFRTDNNTGSLSGDQMSGVSAWSPTLGISSQQGHSRNNDVFARGAIAMTLKDSTYLGYFKSLQWTQDAKDPFQWHFSFVFQVERTITLLELPPTSTGTSSSVYIPTSGTSNVPIGPVAVGPSATVSTLPNTISNT
jgi:hypothetical protein